MQDSSDDRAQSGEGKEQSKNQQNDAMAEFINEKMTRRQAIGKTGKLAIGVAAAAIIAGGVGGYYLYSSNKSSSGGTTLNIAPTCCPGTLDPHNYTGVATLSAINFIAENLATFDTNLNFVPSLATSWTRTSNTAFQFNLRQNVKFHDGTPFNAQAVEANINRMIPAYVGKTYFQWLMAPTVVDDNTIVVNSSSTIPDGIMLNWAASMQSAMISPAAINQGDTYVAQNLIGTGPFMQKSFNPSSLLGMAVNTNYWGGAPSISTLNYQLVPDEQSRELSLLAGNLNFIGNIPPSSFPSIQQNSKYNTVNLPALQIIWFGVNTQRYDTMTSQAFFYAIDKNSLLTNVFGGLVQNTNVPLPLSNPYALSNNTYGANGKWPFDLSMAKSLLQQAGWAQQNGGWYKNGEQLSASVMTTNGDFIQDQQCAQAITSMLQTLGVNATTTVLDNTTDFANVSNADYDTMLLSFSWLTPDFEATGGALFKSNPKLSPQRATWTTFYNPQADQLIESGDSETDAATRMSDYQQVQQLVMDWGGFYPIGTAPILYAWDANIKGIVTYPTPANLSFTKATVS